MAWAYRDKGRTAKMAYGRRQIGSDTLEEKAHELAVQTFYLNQDEYSALHRRYYRTSKKDREQMEKEGLEWKKGRWSVQEVRILKRNVQAFMKEYGVSDIESLIFDGQKCDKRLKLYRYMAKDIRRPLFSIYRKAIMVFDVQNYVGKWTAEKDEELCRLHTTLGNKWAEMGRHIGVSGRAAHDRFKQIHRRKRQGQWSESEEQKLLSAMAELQKQHNGRKDDLPEGIRWEDVAAKVETRNAIQCHHKWVLQLSWRNTEESTAKWGSQDDLKLIRMLSCLNVEDEEEVDWHDLCNGWPAAHNAACLRLHWAAIRRRVPHYHIQTLHENMEYLLHHQVPALEHCNPH